MFLMLVLNFIFKFYSQVIFKNYSELPYASFLSLSNDHHHQTGL